MKSGNTLLAITAVVCFAAVSIRAQNFSIDWFTIDGGGGASTGGVYSVSGTVGQTDAGVMASQQFSIIGGFWSAVHLIQTPGAPLLRVERLAAGGTRIFWARPAEHFVLDQTTVLAPAHGNTLWAQVPFPYHTNATEISITSLPAGKTFYRLRRL